MKIEYTPLKAFKIISAVLFISIFLIINYSIIKYHAGYTFADYVVLVPFVILLAFLCLFSAFGTRFYINNNHIEHLKYFVWKRTFLTSDIMGISYRLITGGKGALVPTLYIYFYVNNKVKYIYLPSMHYSEKVLIEIASNIVKLKPSLQIDPSATELLRKG